MSRSIELRSLLLSDEMFFSWETERFPKTYFLSCVLASWEIPTRILLAEQKVVADASCACSARKTDNLMVNVTIKFNYAIKLYLIAKCVACETGFCDVQDWLNEINGLLSISACTSHEVIPVAPSGVEPERKGKGKTVTQSSGKRPCKFPFQIFTFSPFTSLWQCQSFNFHAACVSDVVDGQRVATCFVFDLK